MNKYFKKFFYSLETVIGFILSPVSWWNDLIVNFPLSYLFALPFGFINNALFLPAFIVGYWITNIVGFIMMHHGITNIIEHKKEKNLKKDFRNMLIISFVYTILIVFLIQLGILQFPEEFLRQLGVLN